MPLSETAKEQVKLRATFINDTATGIWLAGVFGPLLTLALSEAKVSGQRIVIASLIVLVWFPLGVVLHLLAVRHLQELDR